MFNKILVANRGEIACRVIRTAQRLGIATVAVYSEADAGGLHTRMADEAVLIGPAPSAESYLKQEVILQAAKSTGAEAIHPGFGFLSENAGFARAVREAGLVFLGPPEGAIAAMGDKIESKLLAERSGVNTIPGHTEAVRDAEQALGIARDIGYPVMLKASAGGGGKGMRIARGDDEVSEGFLSATSEASSSFGDDRVFIEKYIEQPRHIEIQVLGDAHGNVVYLGERECSIQRRHQKVIEEAPSPFLDEATRAAMGAQAVGLAKAVDYQSAGTVEFIVDRDRNFYFLEMNTRLQVEHPVTEFITGLDLVEEMIKVGAGHPLEYSQDDIKLSGWAVEARVYAEDPERNFLPSIGRLVRYRPPAETEHVRVDSGVHEGGEISMYYDPMIAKLVTAGVTREAAVDAMGEALNAYTVHGVAHNIPFLSAVVHHPRFRSGDLSTAFIDEEFPDGFSASKTPHQDPESLVALAALLQSKVDAAARMIGYDNPDHTPPALSNRYTVFSGDDGTEQHEAELTGASEVALAGRTFRIESRWKLGDPSWSGRINGTDMTVQVSRQSQWWELYHNGRRLRSRVLGQRAGQLQALMPIKRPPDMSKFLLSPMPGLLLRLSVAVGEEVKAGQELAVVEAMKMENVLFATHDATVAKVLADPGQSLSVDQPIVEFDS